MDVVVEGNPPSSWMSPATKSKLFGLLIVFGIVVSWVGSGEFANYSEQYMKYDKNFFIVYILDTWNILILPLYFLFSSAIELFRTGSVSNPFRKIQQDMDNDGMTKKKILLTAAVSTFNQVIADYGYFRALSLTSTSSGIVIFNLSSVFAYILSLVILKERFSFFKALSVLLAFAGAAAITFSDQINFKPGKDAPPAWIGDVIMGSAALFWALFLVCYKKFVGDPSFGTINLQGTLVGFINTSCLWIVLVIFHYTGVETFELPSTSTVWMCVLVTTGLGFINNYLFTFGTAVTSPVFVTIGGMLAIPGSALVDWWVRDVKFSVLKIIGTLIMICGFLLINFEVEEKVERCLFKRLGYQKIRAINEEEE